MKTGKPINPWERLDAMLASENEAAGPGWFTVQQYAARYKCSDCTARIRLNKMVADGALEQWTGRAATGRNALKRRLSKYRFTK